MTDRLSALELMEKLVSFPTLSSVSNLPLIDWVEGYLKDHGIIAHRHYDETGEKAALFAHVGPAVEGAVVLSGHTDVVPVEGQPWAGDPFRVTERGGRYYGRGCCDMKGFDALAIWALVEAQHRGLKRPLQIALSYDEETGCTGAPPMIAAMLNVLPKGEAVIVGEPSGMDIVTGHKGGASYGTHMIGVDVHSSMMHRGVNAIMEGAKLITWANDQNAANRAKAPSVVAAIFDPPWTTVHVGTIRGGTAHNITARDCWFDLDFRVLPDEDPAAWREGYFARVQEVEADMQTVCPQARIEIEEVFSIPPLRPEADGRAEALARRITGANGSKVVSYGTEAGHFQSAGYSVVVCGPGDIAQAHQPDEYIEKSQFEAGHAFMCRLLDQLAEG